MIYGEGLETRSDNSGELAEILHRLDGAGEFYLRAFKLGLRCNRLTAIDGEQSQFLSLIDVVDESPAIALNALRGFAVSRLAQERQIGALAAPRFYPRFGEPVRQILSVLVDDTSGFVSEAAKGALVQIGEFVRQAMPPSSD